MTTREAMQVGTPTVNTIPEAASRLVNGRPVRWSQGGFGDFDGRERTLEIFDVDAAEQLACLRLLRPFRSEWSEAVGGAIVVLFHTRRESQRLHDDFVASWYREHL